MVPVIALLLACASSPPVDPAMATLGQAVALAEQGEAALAAGDARTARARFEAARALRPEDALLGAWAARAAAAQGDVDAALALLDAVLGAAPRFGEARYQRACYRARQGDLQGTADDLRAALDAGVVTPRQALRDPDIAAVAGAPELSFLPDAPFEATLTAPTALAFFGTEVEVRVDVSGAATGPIFVDEAGVGGPLALVRVVEDEVAGPQGDRVRSLRWTYRVLGAGEVTAGPVQLRQGPWSTTTGAAHFATAAPPERAVVPGVALDARTPSAVLGDRVPPTTWRDGDTVWVAVPPGGKFSTTPPTQAPPVWPLRHDGEPVVDLYPLPAQVTSVRVRVDDAVVLDGPPSP